MIEKEEGEEEIGLIVKYKWNKAKDKLFKYYYQEYDTALLSSFQLDPLSKLENGIAVSFENQKDTANIGYYKMGKVMPLNISIFLSDGSNTRSISISELSEGAVLVDIWRNSYQTRIVHRNDSTFIDYLLGQKIIFKELYYWGERKQRNIINTMVFDSVLNKYNSKTGAQIFNENCTSCHRLNKDANGPTLEKITQRRTEAWLRKWIRNSLALIAEGDPDAVSISKQWGGTMTAFPLPDAEMDKLIGFLKTL